MRSVTRVWIIRDHPYWVPRYVAELCSWSGVGRPEPIPGNDPIRGITLSDLRGELERRGHHRFVRHDFDEKNILECWV